MRDTVLETLDELPRRQARERPDDPAIVFGGRTTSFAELDRAANRVANALAAEGVGEGGRVAILAKNTDRWFELFFGALKLGAALVPVNFRLAAPEVAYILDDAKAEILFVDPDHTGLAAEAAGGLATVRKIVRFDGARGEWPDYLAWRDAAPDTDTGRHATLEEVAVQMYTSGTTGRPKGAQLTHRNIAFLLAEGSAPLGYSARDVNLTCMPLFHIAGNSIGLIGLHHGARGILLPEAEPEAILRAIQEEGVTRTLFVPAVILFLMQHPRCKDTDFSTLEMVSYGASPIPFDLLRQAVDTMGCDFIQLYGLTETTGMITWLPPADHDGGPRMKSVGIATPGSEVRVVDAEGRDCAPGEVGEVVIRSPQTMIGYWNLPEATAAAIRDGWFHSGDAGYMDADGYLYLYDRIKDMIISGGENVYPAEVESVLFEHPAVADVAVIGVPDDKWGEVGKAVVVLADGQDADEAELLAFARERVAHFKAPKSAAFVDALPRNPSGKLLKRELRERFKS